MLPAASYCIGDIAGRSGELQNSVEPPHARSTPPSTVRRDEGTVLLYNIIIKRSLEVRKVNRTSKGINYLKVVTPFLEKILKNRIARRTLSMARAHRN